MSDKLVAPKLPKGYYFKVKDSAVRGYVMVHLKKKYLGFIPLDVSWCVARTDAYSIQCQMQYLKERQLAAATDKQLLGCYPPKTIIG